MQLFDLHILAYTYRSPDLSRVFFVNATQRFLNTGGPRRNRNCPTPVTDGLVASRNPPVRVQVVRAGASLDQVVGQDDRPDEPIIVARQQPVRSLH